MSFYKSDFFKNDFFKNKTFDNVPSGALVRTVEPKKKTKAKKKKGSE